MDKKMNELPLWYKLTSAASIGFLAGCTVSGGVSPTIDSNPGSNNNPNNVDAIPTKTDFEKAKETLNSFVTSHPEYSNREASVVNFSINNIDSNTVILETTEEEKQEISSFKYEFDGYPLQQYDKAIVFTMKTNPDGKSEWVRLAGVWFPTEDGSVNTAWYYSPDAFDKNKEVIDFKQRVFGFNSRDDEYVFWPLVEPPYQMLWSLDISSKDSKDYTPWNGIDPFTLPVGAIPVGAGKALFAPMQVDIKPESLLPQEVKDKFETAGIDLKDMTNAKYDKNGLSITLESGEVVLLTNEELEKNIFLGQDNVLQYRDASNQNVIYAYDKESGKWVVDIGSTEAGAATIAILNELRVPLDSIELKMDGDVVVCVEKSTGDEVCRDGLFTLDFIHEALGKVNLVGGLQEEPDPNGSRGHQPNKNSVIKTYLVELAAQFSREYKKIHGVDPYGGDMKNGRIEYVMVGDNYWAVVVGSIKNGRVVFENFVFRPKGNESTIKWYPILPTSPGMIDQIWVDEK